MRGCRHNLERRVDYHFTKHALRYDSDLRCRLREVTAQPGDWIRLRCPKGCPDIVVIVTGQNKTEGGLHAKPPAGERNTYEPSNLRIMPAPV